ncbi:MAG: DUF1385 domain-containing protein [Chloroflexota bacterium]
MATIRYGGQAVIEGVMMRGRLRATVVMRAPDGSLVTYSEELPSILRHGRIGRLPLIRGLLVLWEMIVLGTRLMLMSVDVQARGELGREVPRGLLAVMLVLSLGFAVVLFFLLPLLAAQAGLYVVHSGLLSSLLEGLVRLGIFLGYLAVVGHLGQMNRVFQYHGAEHKTINAFEANAPLRPDVVQKYSIVHIRCGTAFLLWVVVISILVFALIGHPPLLVGALLRLLLVPVVAALGYEVLQLGVRYYHVGPVRWLLQPGLWMQQLTTRPPSDDQIQVAIAALLPVLEADGVAVPAQSLDLALIPVPVS